MAEYVSPEVSQDPAAIRDQMIDDLADDGINVRPATPTYFLLAVFAFLWARLAEQSSQVFSTVFRYFLQRIARIPYQDAVAAVTTVTFTAQDDDGPYSIPVGTEINLRGADGTAVPFRTTTPATIPNGSTTITSVTVVAVTPGTASNDLSVLVGDGVTQTFTWLDTVTVLAPSTGGVDAMTDEEYQDDGAELLQLPLRSLVRPVNFELYSRRFPGVTRALAINNDPAPGHIKVYVVDEDGADVTSPTKAALLDDLQELSMTNLIPHVGDPTRTPVAVAFTGVAEAGYDPPTVEAAAEAAVALFMDNALWGTPTQGDNTGSNWREQLIVRWQDISTILNQVPGFDYHTVLTLNGTTGDVALAGPAALPTATVNGTVTAP